MTDVSEDVLEASVGSIPDLDTGWMSSDKSVEDRVVKHAQARIFVSQMVVNRLIIVVENE